ncbi:MAG: alanyl-tRNA editing protein [Acidobacteria bacterium]|nr:alanyl-tRNA editing protein [Acidobacteriota bacterium]
MTGSGPGAGSPAYERNSYLESLETDVVGAGEEEGRPYVVLADTVLYAEGGGQPADRGWIGEVEVTEVRRAGRELRHYLAGTPPTGRVVVRVDWPRRFDHMQQHTAQHLLTAVAQDRFGWPTTAFHLGPDLSDVELDVPSLGPSRIDALEDAAAAEIRAARAVAVRWVAPDSLAELPGLRTRGLPEGFAGDVRLVEIAGLDLNTCGGTHLRSTAEIEALKLVGVESMRGGTRVHFVAGGRLRRRLGEHEARNARLRTLLGAADDELHEIAGKKLEQLREAERASRALEGELAEALAASIARGADSPAEVDLPGRGAAFLQRLARAIGGQPTAAVVLLVDSAAEPGPFVLCAAGGFAGDVAALFRALAAEVQLRGGGSGRVFQGKLAAAQRGPALDALRRALGAA